MGEKRPADSAQCSPRISELHCVQLTLSFPLNTNASLPRPPTPLRSPGPRPSSSQAIQLQHFDVLHVKAGEVDSYNREWANLYIISLVRVIWQI